MCKVALYSGKYGVERYTHTYFGQSALPSAFITQGRADCGVTIQPYPVVLWRLSDFPKNMSLSFFLHLDNGEFFNCQDQARLGAIFFYLKFKTITKYNHICATLFVYFKI